LGLGGKKFPTPLVRLFFGWEHFVPQQPFNWNILFQFLGFGWNILFYPFGLGVFFKGTFCSPAPFNWEIFSQFLGFLVGDILSPTTAPDLSIIDRTEGCLWFVINN
jgi:hypothetical protein